MLNHVNRKKVPPVPLIVDDPKASVVSPFAPSAEFGVSSCFGCPSPAYRFPRQEENSFFVLPDVLFSPCHQLRPTAQNPGRSHLSAPNIYGNKKSRTPERIQPFELRTYPALFFYTMRSTSPKRVFHV